MQDPDGRFDTRVKISEMSRCWMLVSYRCAVSQGSIAVARHGPAYQLCVEFGQARLALAIEDQEGVDHFDATGVQPRAC